MIKVDLKGNVKELEAGVTAAEVAKSIGMGLYKSACAARIDGEVCDLRTPLTKDCSLEILTFDDPDGKHAFWHTAAHVMAQAVQHLFPEAKFGIGPALENGWYYDIKVGRSQHAVYPAAALSAWEAQTSAPMSASTLLRNGPQKQLRLLLIFPIIATRAAQVKGLAKFFHNFLRFSAGSGPVPAHPP